MGLCERSLYIRRHLDPGFSARNLVALGVFAQEGTSESQIKQTHGTLREAVGALPGVQAVTLASSLPLYLGQSEIQVQIPETDKRLSATQLIVDVNYFDTLGVPITKGRIFNSGDREKGTEVVVINQKMAESLWPGQEPLGKTLAAGEPLHKAGVIGVTADGKYQDLEEAARPVVYYALSQHYQSPITLIARTAGDPDLWVESITRTTRALGLIVPLPGLTLSDVIDFNLIMQRITAGAAAALSVLGIGATMLLRSQLYGIASVEWLVLVPVAAIMLGVALLVAYISARPWVAVDPIEAVRHA